MTKHDLASYLVNLITIMESKEKTGVLFRGKTLSDEYEKHYTLFTDTIKKEKENETRQSEFKRPRGQEDRATNPGRDAGGGL